MHIWKSLWQVEWINHCIYSIFITTLHQTELEKIFPLISITFHTTPRLTPEPFQRTDKLSLNLNPHHNPFKITRTNRNYIISLLKTNKILKQQCQRWRKLSSNGSQVGFSPSQYQQRSVLPGLNNPNVPAEASYGQASIAGINSADQATIH
ncbi:unnamed protein product [Lathyrus oleraceus]